MKQPILKEKVGTANFANVPDQGYEAAHANAVAVDKQHLSLGSLSEWWHHDTRRATYDVFRGNYRFRQMTGQSEALFWNPDVWTGVRGGHVLGHFPIRVWRNGRWRVVSDLRLMPWELLRHNETDEEVRGIGAHWAPVRPALGSAAVRKAEDAHANAARRLERLACRTPHAAVGLGDFNSTGKRFLGGSTLIGDRAIHYADLRSGIPDQILTINGPRRTATLDTVGYFHLPHGDHLHDGQPVGITAELKVYDR